ncbi:MAG: hydroxymethylglutaryl-CoA lyase [Rickettsiales bacterium]|jgi:hydroxymethylglutaryl-CoA lyase|nr:hydroxymethylglutaryl-CoA lyase [Rickettsiales bacterium]
MKQANRIATLLQQGPRTYSAAASRKESKDRVFLTLVNRDALQTEEPVSLEAALALHKAVVESQRKWNEKPRYEPVSFVNPKLVPQAKHSKEVISALKKDPLTANTNPIVLVMNKKGALDAKEEDVRKISIVLAPEDSAEFIAKNMGTNYKAMLDVNDEIIKIAADSGIEVEGYISTCNEDPYTKKEINPYGVIDLLHWLGDRGVSMRKISDTTGMATPGKIATLLDLARKNGIPFNELALHIHDTNGSGVTNALVGYDMGIRHFDVATGGLGKCPFAPGAKGNLAAEDLIYTLENMGIYTGTDLRTIYKASADIHKVLGKTPTSTIFAHIASITPEEQEAFFQKFEALQEQNHRKSLGISAKVGNSLKI